MRLPAALALCLVGASAPCRAVERHVDNVTGNDGNDGLSAETAFRSFGWAVRSLRPGDALHLAKNDEPYRETLDIRTSGTPTMPIIIDGHGAVITGVDPVPADTPWKETRPGVFRADLPGVGAPKPEVDGVPLKTAGGPGGLRPGGHFWDAGVLWIAPPGGRRPENAAIGLIARINGVSIHASHITVRDVVAEHCANDGFNAHGHLAGLRFERVEGRYCRGGTSQGLSMHEDIDAVVVDGRFHHNRMGVADVHRSRTDYLRCVFHDNSGFGAEVRGREHSFTDCVFRDNAGDGLRVASREGMPVRAAVTRCLFSGNNARGLVVDLRGRGGSCVVSHCVFLSAGRFDLSVRGSGYKGDWNLFVAPRISLDGVSVASMEALRAAFGCDEKSVALPEARLERDKGASFTIRGRPVGPRSSPVCREGIHGAGPRPHSP